MQPKGSGRGVRRWRIALTAGALILATACRRVEAAVSTPMPAPTAAPTAAILPTPTQPAAREEASPPAPPPTLTAAPYTIEALDPPVRLGVTRLYLAGAAGLFTPQPVLPETLRLPTPSLRADTGRFGETRYTMRLVHLGSDYLNPSNDPMAPPSEQAVLAAALHIRRSTYVAIALDLSGNVQIYLLMLDTPEGPRQYLFCYAHLSEGSLESAVEQARASGGRVAVMGQVSRVSHEDSNLSDIHIGVIDVEAMLAFTGASDVREALLLLLSDTLPRTNQQYPAIFVEPEAIFPALQEVLETRSYDSPP